MPERRIDEPSVTRIVKVYPCRHPDHEPAKMLVRQSGLYEHTCPGCGAATYFRVDGPVWTATPDPNVAVRFG